MHHEQPAVIAVCRSASDPVPAARARLRLAIGLVVETKGNRAQGSRADIPVQPMPEENLRLIIGFPERSRIFGVVYLPVGLLGITKPEGRAVVEDTGQKGNLEADLVLRLL